MQIKFTCWWILPRKVKFVRIIVVLGRKFINTVKYFLWNMNCFQIKAFITFSLRKVNVTEKKNKKLKKNYL